MAKKAIATNAQNIDYAKPGSGAAGYGVSRANAGLLLKKLYAHRNESNGGSKEMWEAMVKNTQASIARSPNSATAKQFQAYLDTGALPAKVTKNFLKYGVESLDYGFRTVGHDQQNKSNFLDSTFGKILSSIAAVVAGVATGGLAGIALGSAIGGLSSAASTRPSALSLAGGVIGGAAGGYTGGNIATGIAKAGSVGAYASNTAHGIGNFIAHPITGIQNALSPSTAASAGAAGVSGANSVAGSGLQSAANAGNALGLTGDALGPIGASGAGGIGAAGGALGAGLSAAGAAGGGLSAAGVGSGFGSIVGSILATAAPIAGAIIGGKAAKSAAKGQTRAANNAAAQQLTATRETIQAQKEATAIARGDVQPWRLAGEKGLMLQQQLLGINPYSGMKPDDMKTWLASKGLDPNQAGYSSIRRDSLQKQYQGYAAARTASIAKSAAGAKALTPANIMALDPGYQFRLNQGNKAIDASSAALRGPGLSGATLKELTRYGSDYASNEFGNIFSRASNLSGQGLGAATGQANFTQAGANNIGDATMTGAARAGEFGTQAANATAAGTVASGNAIGGAINNIGQQIYLKNLLNPQP